MKTIIKALSVLVLAFGFIETSSSTIITITFDGEITNIRESMLRPMPATWRINVGGHFSGIVQIDTSTPISGQCSEYSFLSPPSCYYGPASASVQFGDYVILGPRVLDLLLVDPNAQLMPFNGIYLNGLRGATNAPGMYVEDYGLYIYIRWTGFPISSLEDLVTYFNLLTFTGGTSSVAASCCGGIIGSLTFIDANINHVTASIPDTIPPVLTLPASFTVDATSPHGATVNYTVTATDNSGKPPTVSCIPKSGLTFAIGVTTVNCTATDGAGNSTPGSFTVTVNGAAAQLANLITMVGTLSSPFGTTHSLDAKLQNAMNGGKGACNSLGAFINEAHAQSGKMLPAIQANMLIASANQILAVLGCQ